MSLRAQSLKDIFTFTRASTATYFDSAGVMTTAAVDEPRVEYDPVTLTCRGLLIEEQRTNLILNSATFATQNVTVTNVAHTLSFYGTGTIALTGTASPEVSLVGTGASTRVSLTFTPTAGTLTLTLTGSATLAQLEAGAHATSYIATTTEAVTRAADVCYMTTLEPWFSEDEGTVFTEYLLPWTYNSSDSAYGRRLVDISDGTVNNRHIPCFVSGGLRYGSTAASTTTQAELDMGAFTAGAVQKQAYAWAENDIAIAASGGQFSTDTSATMPAGLTTIYVGGPVAPNGYIRKVKFYPRRLTNADLAALVA